MKYSILLILCILCILVSGEDITEDIFVSLLSTQIQSATCDNKCSGLISKDQEYKCLKVCQDGSVCDHISKYSWLCGEGCIQACSSSVLPLVFIQNLEQESCVLSWKLNEDVPIRYIIGAQDRSGMLKILRDGISSDWIHLTPEDIFLFDKMFLLAVSSDGLADKASLDLNPLLCNPTLETQELIQPKPGSKNMVYLLVSVLVLFCAVSTTLILSCVLCRRRTSVEKVESSKDKVERLERLDMFVDPTSFEDYQEIDECISSPVTNFCK